MRLSELLRQPDFIDAGVKIVANWKTTDSEYLVLGRPEQSALPVPLSGNTHLVTVTPTDRNPEISYPEELTIRRRLGLRTPPIQRGAR
jgi:hypothetical protein